jgi:hypothetical protein
MTFTAPTLRFARIDEGPVIHTLCLSKKLPVASWIDWSKPLTAGNWIVAETDQPIGCIMINYGTPVGKMDFLVVKPDLHKRLKAMTVKMLCYAAFEQLAQNGSQVVTTTVDDGNPAWQKVCERRGGLAMGSGKFYIKRL